MEYNTSRERLTIPEYGRNIQNMVAWAKKEEDREKRTVLAQAIVKVMGQLNPQPKEYNDYHHKLWDHLHIIAGFELDVDAPYPKPDPDSIDQRPEPLSYPQSKLEYRHYGKNIQSFIAKAMTMEAGPGREAMTVAIANMMKRAYVGYNMDSVSDEVIFEQLDKMSGSMLSVPEGLVLNSAKDLLPVQQKNTRGKNNNNKKKKKRKKY